MATFYHRATQFVRRLPAGSNRRKPSKRLGPSAEPRVIRVPSVHIEKSDLRHPKLVAAALALALLAALVAFYNADAFYVYDFQAIGLEGLTKGDLERAGEFVGHNIFAVNPGRVEEALSRIPEIRSARVSLGFPHQLTIHIQEREPVITWIAGSDLYWIDESGISFRPRSSRTDLPVVRDLEQSAVQPGARVQSDGISAALALRAAWPDAPRQVDWSADRGLALTEAHGWRIYLGNADQMEGKIAILRALLAQLVSQNAKVRFIDLSQGDPFYQ